MAKKRVDGSTDLKGRFERASRSLNPPALAVGVDVTWWGGSGKASEAQSRKECIAFALRTEDGWTLPEFRRVDLTGFNAAAGKSEPNADPDGEDLIVELKHLFEKHGAATKIVVALDAPLLAVERGLPRRKKSQKVGEVERRAADRAWATSVSLSPKGWRAINIQPGSPLPPRIASVVEKLVTAGFSLYLKPDSPLKDRLLIECFPNEVIWSGGVMGRCGSYTFASMTAYKQMGKCGTVLPLGLLEQVCTHTLRPCLELAGLNADGWLSRFWDWLSKDEVVVTGVEGATGKCFDDAIDSVLSLIAAVSFIDGSAHVHQGDDPQDGHIIGPGLPSGQLS
ncbi:hypothetical protein J0H58_13200 [bacterium]|nr:hypothetical protein [bacterium]